MDPKKGLSNWETPLPGITHAIQPCVLYKPRRGLKASGSTRTLTNTSWTGLSNSQLTELGKLQTYTASADWSIRPYQEGGKQIIVYGNLQKAEPSYESKNWILKKSFVSSVIETLDTDISLKKIVKWNW